MSKLIVDIWCAFLQAAAAAAAAEDEKKKVRACNLETESNKKRRAFSFVLFFILLVFGLYLSQFFFASANTHNRRQRKQARQKKQGENSSGNFQLSCEQTETREKELKYLFINDATISLSLYIIIPLDSLLILMLFNNIEGIIGVLFLLILIR